MPDPNAPAPPGYEVKEDLALNKYEAPVKKDAEAEAAAQDDALRKARRALDPDADRAARPAPSGGGGLSVLALRTGSSPKGDKDS
jgi:hypothetical protein